MPSHTQAVQDYLKGIFMLEGEQPEGRAVPTSAIAERLGVTPASATNMLKKLTAMGLVEHASYKGAALSEPGRKIALEVIRHHRLLETYLAQALGVPWDRVHAEAEVLEHVLSEELEERIADRLGHPTADPHGHPIPDRDLSMPDLSRLSLWEVVEGRSMSVERVSDSHGDVLRYLGQVGITPGATVEVVRRGPVAGPLFVRVPDSGDEIHALSKELAEAVWVS
jgi:DtxR family transcriptional regulator, Mn-dependent transcriptional regulator